MEVMDPWGAPFGVRFEDLEWGPWVPAGTVHFDEKRDLIPQPASPDRSTTTCQRKHMMSTEEKNPKRPITEEKKNLKVFDHQIHQKLSYGRHWGVVRRAMI